MALKIKRKEGHRAKDRGNASKMGASVLTPQGTEITTQTSRRHTPPHALEGAQLCQHPDLSVQSRQIINVCHPEPLKFVKAEQKRDTKVNVYPQIKLSNICMEK